MIRRPCKIEFKVMRTINAYQRAAKEKLEQEKQSPGKRPDWLKVKLPTGENYSNVRTLKLRLRRGTIPKEAL